MTQSTAGVAEKVRGYREQIAKNPDFYDGDTDVVLFLIQDTPDRDWSPSEIARALKITTQAAYEHLYILWAGGHIAAHGNGSWRRYQERHRVPRA